MDIRSIQGAEPGGESLVGERCRMIDIGGRHLAVTASGRGTPTVVLETGLGAESGDWTAVQRGIACFTRVCRYDRAGRGDSDAASTPRAADDMVDDVRALLRGMRIVGPYVLVGQSFGGLLVRRYAYRYRDEVAAIVLVDSMHEDQFDVFAPHFPAPSVTESPDFARLRAFWTGGWRDPSSTNERIDFIETLRQAREIRSLGDMPLRVLSAKTFLAMPGVPQDRRTGLQNLWDELQRTLTKLSTDAKQTFVSGGHFLQRDAPEAIIAAVEDILKVWRARQRANTAA